MEEPSVNELLEYIGDYIVGNAVSHYPQLFSYRDKLRTLAKEAVEVYEEIHEVKLGLFPRLKGASENS